MFYLGQDGSSGEVPDGSPLPPGTYAVTEQEYQAVLAQQAAIREAREADDRAAQAARDAAELALRQSAATKLIGLGLTTSEASVVAGLPTGGSA